MTRKERILLMSLAAGMPLGVAAETAGYNLAYATKKAGEPAFLAALEQEKARTKTAAGGVPVDPVQALEEIITDPGLEPGSKVSAVRALIMYREKHQEGPMKMIPIIISELGRAAPRGECITCPYLIMVKQAEAMARGEWKRGEGRAPEGDQGLPEDRQPGEEPGAGSGDPAATAFR